MSDILKKKKVQRDFIIFYNDISKLFPMQGLKKLIICLLHCFFFYDVLILIVARVYAFIFSHQIYF